MRFVYKVYGSRPWSHEKFAFYWRISVTEKSQEMKQHHTSSKMLNFLAFLL